MKINSTVRIASKEYDIIADPKISGASFNTMGNRGRGRIVIGTLMPDPNHISALLVHEIIETIFCETGVRYSINAHEESSFLFVFDHDYLVNFVSMFLDALMSCGLLSIPRTIQIPRNRRGRNARYNNCKKNNTYRIKHN